jgi:hypothetical protein
MIASIRTVTFERELVTMADVIRMNLNVDADVPERLAQLAGGNKRMGAYLSNLIRQVSEGQATVGKPGEIDVLTNAVAHLSAKVKELDARLTQIEG